MTQRWGGEGIVVWWFKDKLNFIHYKCWIYGTKDEGMCI